MIQIKITLQNEQKRGPGFWKFNTSLLRDEVYIDVIRNLIENLKTDYTDVEDSALKWDLIKCDIRQFTIDYSKTQSKIRRQAEIELTKQYEEMSAD